MDTSSKNGTFYAKDLVTNLTSSRKPLPDWNKLVFGHNSTDHMLVIDWDSKNGWHAPEIKPFGNFEIHPFNSTLHYALENFEGTKAYKTKEGDIRTFRMECNMYRMKHSNAVQTFPDFDALELKKCIIELLKVDHMWIPPHRGYSLYIRPTGISM